MDARLIELLGTFSRLGYAVFEDGIAARSKPSWTLPFGRSKKIPAGKQGYLLARLCLYLGMHDYGFSLDGGAAVDNAFTEGHHDMGLDGVAIEVDGIAIKSIGEAQAALAEDAVDRIRVLLLQSKRRGVDRDDVEGADVSSFAYEARRFLEDDSETMSRANENLRRQWEIYDFLRDSLGEEFVPEIILLFTYGGNVTEHENPEQLRTKAIEDLKRSFPNARVEYEVWSGTDILAAADYAKFYRKREFENLVVHEIPKGPAKKAFLGHIPAKDLVDALSYETVIHGKRKTRLDYRFFADNPRYYLKLTGPRANKTRQYDRTWNPGAHALVDTLFDRKSDWIGLGHNGIVIVARKFSKTRNGKVSIIDPQLVNGCQSCFVAWEYYNSIGSAIFPIKLIITDDDDLKAYIAEAANTQMPIDAWDLLALKPEIRSLQREFDRGPTSSTTRIRLRRRFNDPGFSWVDDPDKIVAAKDLVLACQAALFSRPHRSLRESPEKVLMDLDKKIFQDNHEPNAYLAVAWLLVHYKKFARIREDDIYNLRYQLIYAMWLISTKPLDSLCLNDLERSGQSQKLFGDLALQLAESASSFKLATDAFDVVAAAASSMGREPSHAWARLAEATNAVKKFAG